MNDFYKLGYKTQAVANAGMNNATVKKMWNSFCLTEGNLEITPCEAFIFCILVLNAYFSFISFYSSLTLFKHHLFHKPLIKHLISTKIYMF